MHEAMSKRSAIEAHFERPLKNEIPLLLKTMNL